MPKPAKTSIRSSRENRVNAIEDALTAAHGHAVMHCGTTLYGMPEYFMCTRVAEHFANEFSNFQYRLEASVEQVIGCSGSMIPDTNVGGKIATINEVSDDQKATFFFS